MQVCVGTSWINVWLEKIYICGKSPGILVPCSEIINKTDTKWRHWVFLALAWLCLINVTSKAGQHAGRRMQPGQPGQVDLSHYKEKFPPYQISQSTHKIISTPVTSRSVCHLWSKTPSWKKRFNAIKQNLTSTRINVRSSIPTAREGERHEVSS